MFHPSKSKFQLLSIGSLRFPGGNECRVALVAPMPMTGRQNRIWFANARNNTGASALLKCRGTGLETSMTDILPPQFVNALAEERKFLFAQGCFKPTQKLEGKRDQRAGTCSAIK